LRLARHIHCSRERRPQPPCAATVAGCDIRIPVTVCYRKIDDNSCVVYAQVSAPFDP